MLQQLFHTDIGIYSLVALILTILVGVVVTALVLKSMRGDEEPSPAKL